VEAGRDQLAGACLNFFSVQSWVDVSGDSRGITWTTADAPLVERGGINAETPWMDSSRSSPSFYSYALNNYWHTNYKADQEGPMVFRYSLHPHGPFDAAQSVKWGRERRHPLVAVRADAPARSAPLFTVSPRTVIAESVTPAGRDEVVVLLYNPAAARALAGIAGREGAPLPMSPCDPTGIPVGGPAAGQIDLPAHAARYVRVSLNP
jgi:hypothetical protein